MFIGTPIVVRIGTWAIRFGPSRSTTPTMATLTAGTATRITVIQRAITGTRTAS